MKPRILVAPLDWGLGHLTRCIPIIKELFLRDCEIWVACNLNMRQILSREFEQLNFLELSGYDIKYNKKNRGFILKIFLQIPKILSAIRSEHKWLKNIIRKKNFHAVISDNRYGLHHSEVPCIFITHQLNIRSGMGSWIDTVLRRYIKRHIRNFTSCWVPDFEGVENLSGELSHGKLIPGNVKYIGGISRFSYRKEEKKYHIIVILSGPEPQRSILEKILLEELDRFDKPVLFIRGVPAQSNSITSAGHIFISNFMTAPQLNTAILQSEWVICRSGYSSIMDLVTLEQPAILIPTPGQTEQEYLACYHRAQGRFYSVTQEQFKLQHVMNQARKFPFGFQSLSSKMNSFQFAIDQLLNSLSV